MKISLSQIVAFKNNETKSNKNPREPEMLVVRFQLSTSPCDLREGSTIGIQLHSTDGGQKKNAL